MLVVLWRGGVNGGGNTAELNCCSALYGTAMIVTCVGGSRRRQYHKSNSALDLMIGELRLKVDGMQKELHVQNKRLEEGGRFAKQFHNDLRAAMQVLLCSCMI